MFTHRCDSDIQLDSEVPTALSLDSQHHYSQAPPLSLKESLLFNTQISLALSPTAPPILLISPKTMDSDKKLQLDKFHTILQLHLLVDALVKNPKIKSGLLAIPDTSQTRQAFSYLDAITNLMVRDSEVVAAVGCGSTGIILAVDLPCKTLSDENAQVQSASYFSIP